MDNQPGTRLRRRVRWLGVVVAACLAPVVVATHGSATGSANATRSTTASAAIPVSGQEASAGAGLDGPSADSIPDAGGDIAEQADTTPANLESSDPGTPASAADWEPPPARYGVGVRRNVPVTMDDGTVLMTDVNHPTDTGTGEAAVGSFPVILTQTPYGKDLGSLVPPALAGGVNPYFVKRGYIHVVADVRGTGASEGGFTPFDPQQGRDGATLVRWAAKLPNTNGRVGTFGPSYLGIIQFFTAAEVGPDSPLQAIFPMVASNDFYRDIVFMGGIPNLLFAGWFTAGTTLLNVLNPLIENPTDLAGLLKTEVQHLAGALDFITGVHGDVVTGGDRAYDGAFWEARRPDSVLDDIVANDIPAFMVGGWHDLLQRGQPLNYSGLQNAYFGRPVHAPMAPDTPVTGRYQLLQGPWYHNEYGDGIDLDRIALMWFETWLRDQPTGIADTSTPFHTYDLGAERWIDTASYPFAEATPTTYWLDAGGTLSPSAPEGARGADSMPFTGLTSPCNRMSDWSGAGSVGGLLRGTPIGNPCTDNDVTIQVPPTALTYTTDPFDEPAVLAGPIGVTLHATSTRPETMFVVTVEDIHPDGSSEAITHGALLGSMRELDAERTWRAPDGRPLLPYHPYTRESARPVEPGAVTRYDIEVFPTMVELAPGHRLRLTINTGSLLSLIPPPDRLVNLLGGVYQIQRNDAAASFVEVLLAPPEAFVNECAICR